MSDVLLLVAWCLFCVMLLQVKLEEKSLLERYGQVYADYKAKVKRLIPYVY